MCLHVSHTPTSRKLLHLIHQNALRAAQMDMLHEVDTKHAGYMRLSLGQRCCSCSLSSQQQEQRVSEALVTSLQSTQGGARVSGV